MEGTMVVSRRLIVQLNPNKSPKEDIMKSFIELKAQAPLSVEDIIKLYNVESTPVEDNNDRLNQLLAMSVEELANMVLTLEAKQSKSSLGIVDLTERMLADESLITTPHTTLALAINQLIPGATSTNKSVASIYSKGKDKGLLPRL